MRVSRAGTGGTLFNYLCDGADPASPVLKDGYFVYTQGIGQTSTGGNVLTYILDRLGDSTRVMDSTQSITDTQVFDAFGNSVSRTGTTWPMPFGFVAKSGYQTDQDTGLQLLGHRFYDPTIGRFLSRDPIHAGANDYAYCANEPVARSIRREKRRMVLAAAGGPIPVGKSKLGGPYTMGNGDGRPVIHCGIEKRPGIEIHSTKTGTKLGWFRTNGCIRVQPGTLRTLIQLVKNHPSTLIVTNGP